MKLHVTLDPAYLLPWSTQVGQYPRSGPVGVSYFRGDFKGEPRNEGKWVDCLLWRDHEGYLRGILNYYAMDIPPWERAGNFNMWVDPEWQRLGIASTLVAEADKRWNLNFEKQMYSPQGALVVGKYLTAMSGEEWVIPDKVIKYIETLEADDEDD